jgi:hypothetical protein
MLSRISVPVNSRRADYQLAEPYRERVGFLNPPRAAQKAGQLIERGAIGSIELNRNLEFSHGVGIIPRLPV